jgi:hypothetical protein
MLLGRVLPLQVESRTDMQGTYQTVEEVRVPSTAGRAGGQDQAAAVANSTEF